MTTKNTSKAGERTHWVVDGPAHCGRVVTDDDNRIIVAENLSIEDARLIAAAPELLLSCIELLALVQLRIPNNSAEVHRAIRSISKTEGK